jgi:energy-coupling factor transporter ATP-binding protein EcfA2
MMVPVMVVTGPVGVGKTTVAEAISGRLSQAYVAHAMVDQDALRRCYPDTPGDPFHAALGLRNLAAVWSNFRANGATHLVVADVIETSADLAGYRAAIPGAAIHVVRLLASIPTIHRRLEGRANGGDLEWHRHRAIELTQIQDRNQIGDILVDTEAKTVAEIADEALRRVGWPDPSSSDSR